MRSRACALGRRCGARSCRPRRFAPRRNDRWRFTRCARPMRCSSRPRSRGSGRRVGWASSCAWMSASGTPRRERVWRCCPEGTLLASTGRRRRPRAIAEDGSGGRAAPPAGGCARRASIKRNGSGHPLHPVPAGRGGARSRGLLGARASGSGPPRRLPPDDSWSIICGRSTPRLIARCPRGAQ